MRYERSVFWHDFASVLKTEMNAKTFKDRNGLGSYRISLIDNGKERN